MHPNLREFFALEQRGFFEHPHEANCVKAKIKCKHVHGHSPFRNVDEAQKKTRADGFPGAFYEHDNIAHPERASVRHHPTTGYH